MPDLSTVVSRFRPRHNYLFTGRGAYVAELQVSWSVRLGAGEELKGSSVCCVGYCEEGMFPVVLVFASSVFIVLSVQLSFVHG